MRILEGENLEILNGIIHKISFQNDTNGYTVALLNTQSDGQVTVVGSMPFVEEGDDIEVAGEYIIHPTYGSQFKVASFDKKLPTNAAAILRYLSSGAIKGVGPSTARRIVETFGEDTMDIISNSPEELVRIKGISSEKAALISEYFKQRFSIRDVILLLSKFNFSTEDSLRIFKHLGINTLKKIEENPYLICDNELNFSFEKAEDIAEYLKIPKDSLVRVCSGIEYVLRKNLLNGHTCLPKNKMLDVCVNLLDCSSELIKAALAKLSSQFKIEQILVDGIEYVAIPELFAAEEYSAARLVNMIGMANPCLANKPLSTAEIEYVQKTMGIALDDKQKEAVIMAFNNSLFILTGGPGTGKTTTLKAIIELFEYRDLIVELAAPTGRAAKRMSEVTSREAKTIHRLLEVQWSDNDNPIFMRNERNPLECDVLIIDEVSMVDSILLENILRALNLGTTLILVGDSDQLPSVSAGNVLNDLLTFGHFASVRLQKVFRQAEQSSIVVGAHNIINGQMPSLKKDSDLFFLKRNDGDLSLSTVIELCKERLPSAYGFDPKKEIQVLCPSRMLKLGTINLNQSLQNALNPSNNDKQELFFKGVYFRVGDKVMQTKNNYELLWKNDKGKIGTGVFNGDIGTVEAVNKRAATLTVRFDDKVYEYLGENLNQIELAYAITVHKSQGSEFNCVILPLYDVPSKLCYRNLLYTAVTRAKQILIIVGKDEVIYKMIENNRKTLRYTLLKKFLGDGLCLDL